MYTLQRYVKNTTCVKKYFINMIWGVFNSYDKNLKFKFALQIENKLC